MQITSDPAIISISLYVYMDKDIIYTPQYDTMKGITGVSKMCCDGVIQYLEKEKVSILIKDRHTCLDLNDRNMYVLKKGIVKVSLIMQDEREFNITYLQGPDVVSLYCDCLTQFRDCHPKIRIESEQAEFYCISKEKFYKQVKEDANLQNYVNTYYRNRLKLAITREQVMIMNSKAGGGMFLVISFSEFIWHSNTKGYIY